MLLDRRTFLIGSGALLTADFIQRISTATARAGQPFLFPADSPVECLYANRWDDSIQLALWEPTQEELPCDPPWLPTWEEYLTKQGYDLRSLEGVGTACEDWEITPTELLAPMRPETWDHAWNATYCPTARAYRFLENLDLGVSGSGPTAGGLLFQEGQYPGSFDRWVDAEDDLTLSLLQARFTELGLPIKVQLGAGF